MMDRQEIEGVIPHRAPLLLLERVEELEPGVRCLAKMYVDEGRTFSGHFPGRPMMPGVLLIEAVAQTAAVMMASAGGTGAADRTLLAAVNHFKFLKVVLPGQEVRLETTMLTAAGAMAIVGGSVLVEGVVVARGELSLVCS